MQKIILFTLVFLVSLFSKLNAQQIRPQEEWSVAGSKPESYKMGLDSQNSFTIKSIQENFKGFGTLMKTMKPDSYLGKTVKMSGYVKSENVKNWAGLWMRVDFYDTNVFAFDNMESRGIKGNTEWTKYEIVLFVPKASTSISYGVLLDHTGQIWFKDIQFEIVDDAIAETGTNSGRDNKVISFEEMAGAIGNQIEKITKDEKEALKKEVLAIENQLESGTISKEKAAEMKLAAASIRANNIETKVAIEEEKLAQLVRDKVAGKYPDSESAKKKKGNFSIVIGGSSDSLGKNQTEINISSLKVFKGQEDLLKRQSKRTTSQFVFAAGLNNVITGNENFENSDYRVWGSHFYEWGLTYNSRILKNNNLVHAKYGLSMMYNNLRATDNRVFVANGKQTNLETSAIILNESRFRNVYLVAPIHLEFDFTPKKTDEDGNTYYRTHKSFRLGVGGYGGIRVKSKQILKYNQNGSDVKNKQKGDFNVSDFNYGLSAYIGHGATSLYVKYDLNPMFKNNTVDQNNISLGVRFDFN